MSRSKDEIKAITSGAGLVGDIFTKLTKAVQKHGGTLEDFHRLSTDAGETEIEKIAEIIVGKSADTYPVTVNYSQTLEEMIAAGRYDWKHSDITAKHFPIEGSGTKNVDILLVHYNKNTSTDAVRADLDKRGLRPAKIEELLAFGAKYPEKQREFPIIALGSVWRDFGGSRCGPYLGRFGSGRHLGLHWLGADWVDICRFAAVRK